MARSRNLADLADARSRAANDDTEQPVIDPALKKLAALIGEERGIQSERDSASKDFADRLKKIRKKIDSLAGKVNSGQASLFDDDEGDEPQDE